MNTRKTGDLPARLEGARRRFERWRRIRKGHARIPDGLWAAAVKMAAAQGISRTAKTLRVGYYALKKQVEHAAAALQHKLGVFPLFLPIKPGKIPFQEDRQPLPTTPHRAGLDLRILQQRLSFFPLEQRQPCPSTFLGSSTKAARV